MVIDFHTHMFPDKIAGGPGKIRGPRGGWTKVWHFRLAKASQFGSVEHTAPHHRRERSSLPGDHPATKNTEKNSGI